VNFQAEFDCPVTGQLERKESFTCARVCISRVQEGREKSMKLSRAYEASTKRADTIMEIERRRREEAERRKREEEEREEAMRPIRAQIQRGDDLISEVNILIPRHSTPSSI
jgi:hypothetical protein